METKLTQQDIGNSGSASNAGDRHSDLSAEPAVVELSPEQFGKECAMDIFDQLPITASAEIKIAGIVAEHFRRVSRPLSPVAAPPQPTISDLQDYFGEQFDKALMQHGFDRTGDCSVGAMAEDLALIVTDKLEEIRTKQPMPEDWKKAKEFAASLGAELPTPLDTFLAEDLAGRTLPELLMLAGAMLNERGGGPVAECVLAKAYEAEQAIAARAALSRQPAHDSVVTGDMFWDDADPENSQHDPHDILDEYGKGEVVRIQQASRESDFFGFYWPNNDGTDNDTEHYFATVEEAEKKLAELKAAQPSAPEEKA